MIEGGFLLSFGIVIPLTSLMVADGAIDIAKGTHHYFGCKVWQKFTKDLGTKEKIERDLEGELRGLEKEINSIFPNV